MPWRPRSAPAAPTRWCACRRWIRSRSSWRSISASTASWRRRSTARPRRGPSSRPAAIRPRSSGVERWGPSVEPRRPRRRSPVAAAAAAVRRTGRPPRRAFRAQRAGGRAFGHPRSPRADRSPGDPGFGPRPRRDGQAAPDRPRGGRSRAVRRGCFGRGSSSPPPRAARRRAPRPRDRAPVSTPPPVDSTGSAQPGTYPGRTFPSTRRVPARGSRAPPPARRRRGRCRGARAGRRAWPGRPRSTPGGPGSSGDGRA